MGTAQRGNKIIAGHGHVVSSAWGSVPTNRKRLSVLYYCCEAGDLFLFVLSGVSLFL